MALCPIALGAVSEMKHLVIYKLYIIIITVIILFCRVVIRHFEVCLILWDWINQEPKDVWSAILPAGDMASEGERIATS